MVITMVVALIMAGGEVVVTEGDRVAEALQGAAPTDTAPVEWCTTDLDCTRQGDTTATCEKSTGTCVCTPSSGFMGEICYPEPDNVNDAVDVLGIFVFTFPDADCNQFLSINDAIATFDSMFQQLYAEAQTWYLCGSVSIAIELKIDAKNILEIYNNMTASVQALALHPNYSTALQYTEGAEIKTSFHPDIGNGIPTCIVLDAEKTIIVENVCRSLDCRSGYQRYDEFVNGKVVAACELITTGDDSPLTDTAIAGIVFGVIVLVVMVSTIIWHFFIKGDGDDETPTANDPFNDESENAPYGKEPTPEEDIENHPYGNDQQETSVNDDDVAV